MVKLLIVDDTSHARELALLLSGMGHAPVVYRPERHHHECREIMCLDPSLLSLALTMPEPPKVEPLHFSGLWTPRDDPCYPRPTGRPKHHRRNWKLRRMSRRRNRRRK